MYAQVVYENETLGPPIVLKFLNPYVMRMLAAKLNEDNMERTNESTGFACTHACINQDREAALISFYVRTAMFEAERTKAEALNMLRLRETLK